MGVIHRLSVDFSLSPELSRSVSCIDSHVKVTCPRQGCTLSENFGKTKLLFLRSISLNHSLFNRNPVIQNNCVAKELWTSNKMREIFKPSSCCSIVLPIINLASLSSSHKNRTPYSCIRHKCPRVHKENPRIIKILELKFRAIIPFEPVMYVLKEA